MKVCLINVDGIWSNLALMKLSAWHKKRGDEVVLIDLSSIQADRFYASKIFVGGSGVDLKSELPPEIEAIAPDYELFKQTGKVAFTSRGCIRDCGFCIVREKEGPFRDLPFEFKPADRVILLDNNFLASKIWREKLEYFIRHKIRVCFSQGLDIRLVDDEKAQVLAQVKAYDPNFHRHRYYFAFDDPAIEPAVRRGVDCLVRAGIQTDKCLFYVITNFGTTIAQDLARVQVLKELGCLPFIMIKDRKKADEDRRRFGRWVNGRFYKYIEFDKFEWRHEGKEKERMEQTF